MDDVGSQAGSINQLPNEILEKLFQYVPTTDILRNCRLVSQNWNKIANFICRDRKVRVSYTERSEVDFEDIFMAHTDLPWSAINLEHWYNPDGPMAQICETFGTQLRSIEAVIKPSQFTSFVQAIRKMPNLENLDISWGPPPPDDFQYESSEAVSGSKGLSFQKLTQMYVNYPFDDQFLDFFDFILKTGAPLTVLHMNYYPVPAKKFRKLVDLICSANIPKVSVVLNYCPVLEDSLKALEHYNQNIGIHELYINIDDNGYNSLYNFAPLGTLLAKCTHLQILGFRCSGSRPPGFPYPTSKLLTFPRMSTLKTLEIGLGIRVYNEEIDPGHQFPLIWFNPLQAQDFPNLETVDLDDTNQDWVQKPLGIDIRIRIWKMFDLETGPFKSVKFLNMGNYDGGDGRFAPIFPNTVKISATLENSEQVPSIFEGMNNVTEVDVTLNSNLNNNGLFIEAFGFIRSLKRLEMLTVRNHTKSTGKALADTGLIILALLHPVNLAVYNAEVKESDSWVTLLRTVQSRLQLLQK